ncbi:sel1 repeat family protein [Saccharospirillum impatiens]|uniref:sel1 repeat family protein n=1 Tax=Saccharospirillum impatiens TaxID=169438 RepID=UPI000410B9EF|nr:sel1 repeat family protein [Saccharospirillum impatiens]
MSKRRDHIGFWCLKRIFHQGWLTRHRWVHGRLMRGFRYYADQGLTDAQELYGFLLLHRGSDIGHRADGARYLSRIASARRPKAAWQMHQCYREGTLPGFAADPDRADHYLQLAAEGGHPLALDQVTATAIPEPRVG